MPLPTFSSLRNIRWLPMLAALGGMAYLLGVLFQSSNPRKQADFLNYYYAVKVWKAGGNPYHVEEQNAAAGRPIHGRFLYPPLTLHLFAPFDKLSERQASLVFLSFKALGIAALLALWWHGFVPPGTSPWWIIALALHAVGRPLGLDAKAGNIAVFEQLGIWCGLLALIRGRFLLFCLLITLTASCKLTPVLFLVPGFLLGQWRDRWQIGGVFLLWLALLFGPMTNPEGLVGDFFRSAVAQDERGSINPCAVAWIRDLLQRLGLGSGNQDQRWFPFVYMPYLLCITGTAAWSYWKHRRHWTPMEVVLVWTLVYTLCVPRMKNYSYMLLVVPLAYILFTRIRTLPGQVALLLWTSIHFLPYQQFYTALLLYILMLRSPRTRSEECIPNLGIKADTLPEQGIPA